MAMCSSEGLQLTFHFVIRSFEEMFLLTATEVILGTAIIMGLSALVTILLRMCSRSRLARNSRNIQNLPDEFGRTGIRISLTSMQQRVMSKLRDRPPRYETRHNYEYQRRERSTRIPVLNPAAATMSNDIPPPLYEAGDIHSVSADTFRVLHRLDSLFLVTRAAASLHHRHRRHRRNHKPFVYERRECNQRRRWKCKQSE